MQGKLIVIDGTDGSGKATQTKLLIKKLNKNGYKVKSIDFPRHGLRSSALVDDYLNGKFGTPDEIGPYRASIFYACDRYAASFKMRKWLEEGYIVIADRYVSSNIGHQASKIKDSKERRKYIDWLFNLEYKIFKIPIPDLTLLLFVPVNIARKNIDKKGLREYIESNDNKDIHEKDVNHLIEAEKSYLKASKELPYWDRLNCTKDGKILSREKIHESVYNKVIALIKNER